MYREIPWWKPKSCLLFQLAHHVHSWYKGINQHIQDTIIQSFLILIYVPITTLRLVCDILQPQMLPLMAELPIGISQKGSARLHTLRVLQKYHRHITTLLWSCPNVPLIKQTEVHLA